MAQRLGNISKSSFRFIREGSLYIYFGIALLGAFYLAYLSFNYNSEIKDSRLDVRSELIAESQIEEAGSTPTRAYENQVPQELDGGTSNNSAIIPVAATESTDNSARTGANNTNTSAQRQQQATPARNQTPPPTNARPAADTRQNTKPAETAQAPRNRRYQWVLKSFNNPEFANNWVQKFKDMGLSTDVVKVNYDGNTWYRVTHGNYSSVAAAKVVQSSLPNIGDEDYWISPAN